jgi:hypothetical protein
MTLPAKAPEIFGNSRVIFPLHDDLPRAALLLGALF